MTKLERTKDWVMKELALWGCFLMGVIVCTAIMLLLWRHPNTMIGLTLICAIAFSVTGMRIDQRYRKKQMERTD